MTKRTLTLVAYDISDHRSRARALKASKAFGLGGQKSVHECALTAAESSELKARLVALIDQEKDRLMFLKLDPRTQVRALSRSTAAKAPILFYVG